MTAIPALTLHRPWAKLIMRGKKNIENRTWHTNYRGPMYIHAGVAWDPHAETFARECGVAVCSYGPGNPTGILGLVDLVSVCTAWTAPWADRCDCGPWAVQGQRHWRLANPRAFAEPVPCRGRQQLWLPPADVRLQLDALAAVA